MMFSSIRSRLTLWYIGVLAIVFTAFAVATYTLFVRVLYDETKTNINEMAGNFVTSVNKLHSEKPRSTPPDALIRESLEEFRFRDYQFATFSHDDKLVGRTIETDLPPNLTAAVGDRNFATVDINGESYYVTERSFRMDGKAFKLFVFFPLSDQKAIESRIKNIFLIFTPILLLFAGLGGYLLARQSLKPVALMGERAKQIGAANLHERLPVANPNDEIGNLALLFNQLLDRLDREFDAQRRFMADASHELRTPLAIVRGESEVALQRSERTDDEYRESLRIVNDEGKRLSKIVEDLFTLARVDSGEIKASFREVYVDEIVEACVTTIRTLARHRSISVEYSGTEMKTLGDEALLQRLFLNLLDNAVKYNNENGTVSVTVKDRTVTVTNSGPEIPENQRQLIFERFFRVDKTHARQAETFTSGAGLGLSIAKWIADIHQATITHDRSENGENIFSVNFPR
jgi:heavy metal sensor kinase